MSSGWVNGWIISVYHNVICDFMHLLLFLKFIIYNFPSHLLYVKDYLLSLDFLKKGNLHFFAKVKFAWNMEAYKWNESCSWKLLRYSYLIFFHSQDNVKIIMKLMFYFLEFYSWVCLENAFMLILPIYLLHFLLVLLFQHRWVNEILGEYLLCHSGSCLYIPSARNFQKSQSIGFLLYASFSLSHVALSLFKNIL